MPYYLGLNEELKLREVFTSSEVPTKESHGQRYQAVIGPFKTRIGAEYMRAFGLNNPNCQTVEDAEKHAKGMIFNKKGAGKCQTSKK